MDDNCRPGHSPGSPVLQWQQLDWNEGCAGIWHQRQRDRFPRRRRGMFMAVMSDRHASVVAGTQGIIGNDPETFHIIETLRFL